MGVIPALGFKTNVKDDEFAEEIARSIADEFENIEYSDNRNSLLVDGFDSKINYTILDGRNEYVGMRNNGLVFDYKPRNWPDWGEFSEKGSFMKEVRDFVDKKFEHVKVDRLMPTTPTT